MIVEDLLLKIRDTLIWKNKQLPFDGLFSDEWHLNFISSIGRHVDANKSLSTKQSDIILKMVEKVRSYLVKNGWATDADITKMLAEPQFRNPLYESTNVPKEVRHIGDNLLAFRSKNNEIVRNKIKTLCYPELKQRVATWSLQPTTTTNIRAARFDWLYKVWIVPVYRFNVADILNLIETERFNIDHQTAHYLRLVKHSFNQPSLFAVDSEIILANVCDDPILASWITEVANGVTL